MRDRSFGMLRRLIAVAALVLVVLLGRPHAPTQTVSAAPPPPGRPLVLVALDAADWLTIDPLVRSGALPAFAQFKARGRTGVLMAIPPLISPMVWTTVATGVEPENHGILDFMQDLPDGRQVPVGSSERLAPALWNLFSDGGRRVAVVGWWATWPAERVRGTIVSDALAPQLTHDTQSIDTSLVSPPSALARVSAAMVKTASLGREDLARYVPIGRAEFDAARRAAAQPGGRFYKDPIAHLAAVIASTRTYAAVAEQLVRDERPDLLAVYVEAIDTVSHLFIRDARRGPQAVEAAYRDADVLIRRIARESTPDTLVVVCSDHGFYPASAGITEDPAQLAGPATAWHRPYGIVAVATAGALAGGAADSDFSAPGDIGTISPLDIAPTLLHAAGLAVPDDMPGRVVTPMLPASTAARRPIRTPAPRFSPPPRPTESRAGVEETLARLQALGYVGTVKTSLARLNLGESFFRRGKWPQAERQLRAVLSMQPTNLSALLWLAQTLERQGRAGEALAVYGHAIAVPGGAREALVGAVDLAIREGRLPDARRLVEAGRAAADARAAAHVSRGTIAEASHDAAAAEREYRAALSADPLSFEAASRLLDLLAAQGRAGNALGPLLRALRVAPDSSRHLALLGQVRLAMRDGPRAEAAFRRVLELSPDSEPAMLALGRALFVQEKFSGAIAVLLQMPRSADRDMLLGAAYSGTREWARAAEHLHAAMDAGRTTPDVLNSLGWAQLQLGRRAEAATLLARSLETDPDQPDIRRLLAEIRAKPPGTPR